MIPKIPSWRIWYRGYFYTIKVDYANDIHWTVYGGPWWKFFTGDLALRQGTNPYNVTESPEARVRKANDEARSWIREHSTTRSTLHKAMSKYGGNHE
jgi:hypothetical protein